MNVAPPRCSLDEVDDDWVESSVSARRRRAARLSDIEDGDNTSRVHRDAAPSACHLSWNRLCAFVKIPAATSAPAWRRALSSVAGAGKQPQALPTPAQRQLLFDCAGCVKPGDLVALMGPSGSGKTTLLSVLGRRSPCEVTGRIAVDGVRGMTKAQRRHLSFVTQDDLLWASLTVWDTLRFAAELRLPRSMSYIDKLRRVDEVIDLLGLQTARHTPIGGALKRGVSGGERKRVCIALELLASPALVFLDEPTSGLDSTIALRLVTTLRGLAAGGHRSVLASIHQPSTRAFAAFDQVMVLSSGKVFYSGAPSDVVPYHASHGVIMQPAEMNPAEWVLDLASADASVGGPSVLEHLLSEYASQHPQPPPEDADSDAYAAGDGADASVAAAAAGGDGWAAPWAAQVSTLLRRNLAARAEGALDGWRVGQVLFVAIISGLLWLNSGRQGASLTSVNDIAGVLFFQTLFLVFLTLFGALMAFPSERAITIKERTSGLYRLSAYYVARSCADLPLDLALPVLFCTILYWMVGLRAVVFVQQLLLVLLSVLVSNSLGLLLSALSRDFRQAQTTASVLVLTLMLVGGFYIAAVPHWLQWLKWLSFITHAYSAALKLQFSTNTVVDGIPVRSSPRLTTVDWQFPAGFNVGVLFAELFALRIGTYFVLRRKLK